MLFLRDLAHRRWSQLRDGEMQGRYLLTGHPRSGQAPPPADIMLGWSFTHPPNSQAVWETAPYPQLSLSCRAARERHRLPVLPPGAECSEDPPETQAMLSLGKGFGSHQSA